MAKKIIRAAAVQVEPIEASVEDTIFHAVKLAKKAAEKEVDIICLPEHWLPEKVIPTPMSPLPGLQSLAEEYSVAVVGGAFYERARCDSAVPSSEKMEKFSGDSLRSTCSALNGSTPNPGVPIRSSR